jgi:hypothetical protein
MSWPDDIPYDRSRKRYYLVHADLRRNPSDFELLNAEDIYPLTDPTFDGRHLPITAGRYRCEVGGGMHPRSYGLPDLRARPRLFVALKNKPLDAYGLGKRYISTRARELLLSIDPDAFEFFECEVMSRRGIAVEPYWMVENVRPVQGFDEAGSVFRRASGVDGLTGEPYDGPYWSALIDIHMKPDLPEHHHAFFFPRYIHHMIFDGLLVDAWRTAGLTGWSFTPLQPPAPKERKPNLYGDSFAYWYGAKYRDGK